jgi:hypothetical protein
MRDNNAFTSHYSSFLFVVEERFLAVVDACCSSSSTSGSYANFTAHLCNVTLMMMMSADFFIDQILINRINSIINSSTPIMIKIVYLRIFVFFPREPTYFVMNLWTRFLSARVMIGSSSKNERCWSSSSSSGSSDPDDPLVVSLPL